MRRLAFLLVTTLAAPAAVASCKRWTLHAPTAPMEWLETGVDDAILADFEAQMDSLVRDWTDAELEEVLAAAIRRYREGPGYLPGLTPEWNLADFADLVADFERNRAALGGSRFGNYLGNVEQIAGINRTLLKSGRGDRTRLIQDYFRFGMEARCLRDLIRRRSP